MPKVEFTDIDGKQVMKKFATEEEGKEFRDGYLKENKIKGKWEW